MRVKSSGYSLIEIMFVVGIIGILMAVMMPGMRFALNRVRRFATERVMDKVESALSLYNMDIGSYPGKREGYLNALVVRPQSVSQTDYRGPYLDAVKFDRDELDNIEIKDNWGRALEYHRTKEEKDAHPPQYKEYVLISHGADEEDQNGYIIRGR